MNSTDFGALNASAGVINEDSVSSASKTGSTKKHHQQYFPPQQATQRASAVDERDKASFYKDLYHFHEVKGTPITRPPRVNGREIDLHKFYSIVCSRGGWSKINYRNEWEDLVPEFDIPSNCVNASVALKQIYMRFLDRYEKIHFLGEDNDRAADENDEDNRHKKWNNKNFNEVPLKYNYQQHNVPESLRIQHKLSTDLYKASEYERLLMSLMSPLPNEQDFAVNVCTLMANESRHTLKIEHCPKLLDALVGHAGVYSHHSMRELFFEFYSNVRKHSLQGFWNDCLHDKPDILELSYEDYFEIEENVAGSIAKRPPVRLRSNDNETFEDGLNTRASELDDISSLDFLNLKRGLGTHDYIGQRVHQVTTICRNLSFFDENIPILVKNRTFIRYLVMCSNIRWGNLHQMGLDTLGNIAIELDLCDPNNDALTKCLMTTIAEGLENADRGVIISCLEILYKLCQKGTNEDHLNKYLDRRIYRQICMYLSLNDIMLLLYTLECLFALTSMGEKSCFAIVQINGIIDTLVSLVSVEAQSYGPDGCILMRVVETVPTHLASHHQGYNPHHHSHQQQSPAQQQQQQPTMTPLQNSPPVHHQQLSAPQPVDASFTTTLGPFSPPEPHKTIAVPAQPSLPSPPPNIVKSTIQTIPTSTPQSPVVAPIPKQNVPTPVITSTSVTVTTAPILTQSSVSIAPIITTATPTLLSTNAVYSEQQMTTIHTSGSSSNSNKQTQDHENEQFALAWLRATFEPTNLSTGRIEQQDLYKMYLTACSKIGRAGVVSQYHFPRCVQNVFGRSVGPNQIKIKQNSMEMMSYFYEGIRIRAQPLAVVHKGTILQAAVTTTPIRSTESQVKKEQPAIVKTSMVSNQIKPNNQTSAPILQHVLSNHANENVFVVGGQNRPNIIQVNPMSAASITVSSSSPIVTSSASTSSSSLIKAILANKVTADGSIIGTPTITTNIITSVAPNITTATSNVNVHQVAQRQHLQKQKEAQMAANAAAQSNAVIAAIGKEQPKTTIVIKTPTGNLTSNMKATINSSTLIPTTIIEKKAEAMLENYKQTWDPHHTNVGHHQVVHQEYLGVSQTAAGQKFGQNSYGTLPTAVQPPPLAPLSSHNMRQTSIIASIPAPTVSPPKADDDSNSTNLSASSSIYSTNPTTPMDDSENAFAGFEGLLIPGNAKQSIDDDGKDGGKQQSHVVTSNKMLADLLERKSSDPPFHISGDVNNKRKIDSSASNEPNLKRSCTNDSADDAHDKKNQKTSSTSSAAKLYEKLAASLLEDEDMEVEETITTPSQQPAMAASTIVEQTKPVITMPMQRQIIMSPNNPPQMILQQNPQIGQSQATINQNRQSDYGSGFPVILQHGNSNQIQIQKQIGGIGQQIIQPVIQQQQTQYVLATNQQGQTYLVAQQQPPPVNQILLQTSQQQGGGPTKTIIILQQQAPSGNPQTSSHQILSAVNSPGTPQKVIMTTQQGQQQQLIVTQMPRPVQHHMIVNQHPMATSANVIQTNNPQISTTSAIINQVATGAISVSSQPQIVPQVQLQQSQAQISLPPPPPPVNQSSHQPIVQIGKQQIQLTQQSAMRQQHATISQAPSNAIVQSQSQISNVISSDKKKVFVTGSGNIEVTPVTQPIVNSSIVSQSNSLQPMPQIQQSTTITAQTVQKPQQSIQAQQPQITVQQTPAASQPSPQTKPVISNVQPIIQQSTPPPSIVTPKIEDDPDANWLFVCDWRGCQRKKFKSANEVYLHACAEHCPDNIDPNADIYCQWGPGPNLCDNLPRKRFSLMTHINDRHITTDSFKAALQRRLQAGPQSTNTQPVTIIKKPIPPTSVADTTTGTASPTLSTSSSSSTAAVSGSSAAMQAIKRHSLELVNPKELMDENEGPVTKSIRLTASLILRNLVNYTTTAKRCLRYYEPHLSGIALSNVESSRTIAQVLYEMNETRPY